MLTDPRAALAEQNTVVTALTGLAGLARTVRALAGAGPAPGTPAPAPVDDLVLLLLGVVRLGDAVERLAAHAEPGDPDGEPAARAQHPDRWLR